MSKNKGVEEILNAEVEKRVNTKFLMMVQDESDKKAFEKIENLKNVELPLLYAANVEPKIKQLISLARDNAIKMIKGPWSVTCNICGLNLEAELTSKGIADFLSTGYILIKCSNQSCRNNIKVSLEDLISIYLTKERIRFA